MGVYAFSAFYCTKIQINREKIHCESGSRAVRYDLKRNGYPFPGGEAERPGGVRLLPAARGVERR